MSYQVPNIDELKPLTQEDKLCLEEVRNILEKHNKLNRFGISLLHSHFSIDKDEALVEFCDEESRTLIIKPVKRSELVHQQIVETNWTLHSGESILACIQQCIAENKQHKKDHYKIPF